MRCFQQFLQLTLELVLIFFFRSYYFFNDIINIEGLDSNFQKIGKKLYWDIDIYFIEYNAIKKIGDYENIYPVNLLYLVVGKVDGHIEEKNKSKY